MNLLSDLQGLSFLEGFFSYTPLLISYAEIHYHLSFLYPKYFKKEPEIITDIPIRIIKNNKNTIPLLFIITDAHLYPIIVNSLNVIVDSTEQQFKLKVNIDKLINERFFSKVIEIDINDIETNQFLQIIAEIEIEINGKKKKIINDNYPNIKKVPYKTFYSNEQLPFPEDWFAGDPHYHSIHTSDQVEFGADIQSTAILAKAMGLNWVFVTDHSYDLDDSLESCLVNDRNLPIWHEMKEQVQKYNEDSFRIVAGEEVSIGNHNKENVHMLAVNHQKFIEGSGDSAEVWFKNKPQHLLKEIKDIHSKDNLFIAAHPFDKIPFMQKLTLNRGNWNEQDYIDSGITFLQAINSSDIDSMNSSIKTWKDLLLKGYKYFIIAGNDAHGNFNVMRQIKSPFWKLFSSQKQVFGKFFTVFKLNNNDPIKGLKQGQIIISNGPFLNFNLKSDSQLFKIGSTTRCKKAELTYEYITSVEFGEVKAITLYIGDCLTNTEEQIVNPKNHMGLNLNNKCYVRMSLTTKKDGIVYTNPIWVN